MASKVSGASTTSGAARFELAPSGARGKRRFAAGAEVNSRGRGGGAASGWASDGPRIRPRHQRRYFVRRAGGASKRAVLDDSSMKEAGRAAFARRGSRVLWYGAPSAVRSQEENAFRRTRPWAESAIQVVFHRTPPCSRPPDGLSRGRATIASYDGLRGDVYGGGAAASTPGGGGGARTPKLLRREQGQASCGWAGKAPTRVARLARGAPSPRWFGPDGKVQSQATQCLDRQFEVTGATLPLHLSRYTGPKQKAAMFIWDGEGLARYHACSNRTGEGRCARVSRFRQRPRKPGISAAGESASAY